MISDRSNETRKSVGIESQEFSNRYVLCIHLFGQLL